MLALGEASRYSLSFALYVNVCLLCPSVCQAAVYSSVNKNCDEAVREEDKEHDYSSIAELKGLDAASSSSDLYATVRDLCPQPQQGDPPVSDGADPGYETIRVPKAGRSDDDEDHRQAEAREDVSGAAGAEPDYESVGELGLARDVSRL